MGKMVILFMTLIFVIGLMITTAGAVPVIIGFKDKAHPEIVQPYGKVKYSYKHIPAVAADLPEQAIENLKKNNNIAYIEPDYEVSALEQTVPWGITKIGAPLVHTNGNEGTGIKVAIIDTGINYNHPDLNDSYKGGYNFITSNNNPLDDNGHGTHCAGIIAAVDNDIGVIGVAPEANLYSLKVLDSTGSGYISDVIAAIEWTIETRKDTDTSNDIQIISMSLGSTSGSTALETACSQAYNSGILLVAAAGNNGNIFGTGNSVAYPAAYSSVIAVAATDSTDKRAYFSSTGPTVELAAPGVNILSTYQNDLTSLSGTSMACPHVTGTAALVLAANPSFTNGNIRDRLAQTATDLGTSGRDNLYGFGLVNAKAAAAVSTPDETAPIITNIKADAKASSATITWTTDEASNSTVRYSKDKSNFEEKLNSTLVTSHNVGLTGLSPLTTYYYEVKSSDAAENTVVDNNNGQYYSFNTLEENPNYIHIDTIQVTTNSKRVDKSTLVSATAVVKILDNANQPVKGATVSGHWSGATGDTDSAVTGDDGSVTVKSNEVTYKRGKLTFTFTVDNVSHSIAWDKIVKSGTKTYP